MADEVINARLFDQRTTHEERHLTLETLLHEEERYQETAFQCSVTAGSKWHDCQE